MTTTLHWVIVSVTVEKGKICRQRWEYHVPTTYNSRTQCEETKTRVSYTSKEEGWLGCVFELRKCMHLYV